MNERNEHCFISPRQPCEMSSRCGCVSPNPGMIGHEAAPIGNPGLPYRDAGEV
jgi:hypothetical protein